MSTTTPGWAAVPLLILILGPYPLLG